jgi:hypothetical protein
MITLRRTLIAFAVLSLAARPMSAQHESMGAPGVIGSTVIRGFVDVGYLSGGNHTGRNPGFELGQFDLFISSALADRVSFVSEAVFEYDKAAGEFAVDVERVIVGYTLTEHLRLSAGKMHTPIGYWNNAYHHGQALSPTVERPMLFRFEDDGGALPVHTMGVQLSGRDLGPAHLGFDALVGNGLGNHPTADTNSNPSMTLAIHSQLTPSLRVGLSGYQFRGIAGTPTPQGTPLAEDMRQTIGGGYLTYFAERLEAIAEMQQVSNNCGGVTSTSPNWFVYGGMRLGQQFVPYAMHDVLNLAQGDPYFVGMKVNRETLGLRFEQSAAVVLKVELRSTDQRGTPRATDLGAQVAVAF